MLSQPAVSRPGSKTASKYVMRVIGLGYLTILVGVPVGLIFWRTFEHGVGSVIDSLRDPSVLHFVPVADGPRRSARPPDRRLRR